MHIAVPVPGDVVWIRQRRWRVERARRDRNVVRIDVRSRDERLTFLAPFDRPAAVNRMERLSRVRASHALARLADLIGRSFTISTIGSAVDAAIDILPYQLEPSIAMMSGARRVLLADEVGLGKTIQAGLAIAELHRRSPSARTLVVVPSTLRDQWTSELTRRFRIECRAADRHELDALARRGAFGENPWCRPGVWIASFDFVKQRHVIEALPNDPWHLLVVDEAHAVAGDSERHDACSELARRARQVLLLTATPHSGDEIRFKRLLDLGRLDEAERGPVLFRRTKEDTGFVREKRVRWRRIRLSKPETDVFQALAAFESAALQAAGSSHRDEAILLLSVFRKRAVSTMRALRISLERRLSWLGDGFGPSHADWFQPHLTFDEDSDDIDDTDRDSLSGDIGFRSAAERSWLRRLRGLAETAERYESKVSHVASLVARAREPVIVFTEFRHSLEALRRGLQVGSTVAELHGGLTPLERRQQLARFLDGTATILLATDVGGQGLNLQERARWVVSLELPWNPLKLEQRCGRVDRIGQSRSVHFSLVVARHPFEEGILSRLAQRALIARRALGDDGAGRTIPDSMAVGAALFENTEIADSPPLFQPIHVCNRWARPGRLLSKRLLSSRELLRHWRAAAPETSGGVWAPIERALAMRRIAGNASLLIFSVPLIDGSGGLVERHVVAVRIEPSPTRAVVEIVRAHAAGALAARARRLSIRLRRRLNDRIQFEALLASQAVQSLSMDEAQPGLFDQRELSAFEAARSEAQAIRQTLDNRRTDWERQSAISVGRPVLEVAFLADR
jgi:superfamily II DNA or RNA helicase